MRHQWLWATEEASSGSLNAQHREDKEASSGSLSVSQLRSEAPTFGMMVMVVLMFESKETCKFI